MPEGRGFHAENSMKFYMMFHTKLVPVYNIGVVTDALRFRAADFTMLYPSCSIEQLAALLQPGVMSDIRPDRLPSLPPVLYLTVEGMKFIAQKHGQEATEHMKWWLEQVTREANRQMACGAPNTVMDRLISLMELCPADKAFDVHQAYYDLTLQPLEPGYWKEAAPQNRV